MNILIVVASKYGSTWEIGVRIAHRLGDEGHGVDLVEPGDVARLDDYDAVVLGSAVYGGRWLEEARSLAEARSQDLEQMDVWLFSSGPVGHPVPQPEGEPEEIPSLMARLGAREHRVFAGKIDKSKLNFAERAMVWALEAPEGDFRDWPAIEAWAEGIAETLRDR